MPITYKTTGDIKHVFSKIIREYGILTIFSALFVVMSIASDVFLTGTNLLNVARQASALVITAVGMTFVIISAGIDLSVGSIVGFCGTLSAGFIYFSQMSTGVSILLAALLGVVLGFANGFIIARGNIPPFITTLAMLSIARGMTLLYTGGYPIYDLPEAYVFIGRGKLMGLPVSVLVMIIIVAVAWFVLSRMRFGRYVYAVGGNEESARLSGLSVARIKIIVYMISGFTAGVGGILLSARLASGQPTLGQGMELDAIAAVVLGGTSLFGGRGQLWGTIAGGFFLSILGNGLNLVGVSAFWQMILKGLVLLIAVLAYEKGRAVK